MPKKNLFYGNSVLEEVCGGGIAIKKKLFGTPENSCTQIEVRQKTPLVRVLTPNKMSTLKP